MSNMERLAQMDGYVMLVMLDQALTLLRDSLDYIDTYSIVAGEVEDRPLAIEFKWRVQKFLGDYNAE